MFTWYTMFYYINNCDEVFTCNASIVLNTRQLG